MKKFPMLLSAAILLLASCKKNTEGLIPAGDSASSFNPAALSAKGGDSGSSGGGGTTTTTGPIFSVGGLFKYIPGRSDSIQVNLTQAAPAGWIMTLRNSDPAVQVPASFPITAGTMYVHVPVTGTPVTTARTVTITATLQGQTMSSFPFKVFPLHYNFAAPQLQFPGNGSGFKNRIQVKFTWSSEANAYYHDIQISDNAAFSGTPMLEVYTDDPIWAASYFNGLGTRYWRVRYIDGSGAFGPWSAVRNFVIQN